MGIRFLPVPLADVQNLGDRPAIFLAYLKLLSRYADKDGYISRSAAQVKRDLGYGRSIQEACRETLAKRGILDWRLKRGRSPTIEYKLEIYKHDKLSRHDVKRMGRSGRLLDSAAI